MARDGSCGVEKTFSMRSRPRSIHTQSVKVPPVSTAIRKVLAGRGMKKEGYTRRAHKKSRRPELHSIPSAA